MNKLPIVTKNLLAINVLLFLASLVAEKQGVDLNEILGLHFFMADGFYPFQLVTYMFMHGGFPHLFFNMFALYMFGRAVEHVLGTKRFLIFYFAAGIGAGLLQEAVGFIRYSSIIEGMSPENIQTVLNAGAAALQKHMNYVDPGMAELNIVLNVSTVGASGAVYAILLGFGMSFPNERMYIFPLPFPIKAKFFVLGYAALELLLGMSGSNDGVAHFAHLGGMLFGLVLILYWRRKKKIGGPYYV